ncbi:MAG TPA: hypothetical protein VI977_06105 [archaeon]|nr:hypothetical protein [archaeon]
MAVGKEDWEELKEELCDVIKVFEWLFKYQKLLQKSFFFKNNFCFHQDNLLERKELKKYLAVFDRHNTTPKILAEEI